MNWLKRKRIKQVLQYGWHDAKEIATVAGKSRLVIWLDIISCFMKYYIFSNQYKSKEIWKLCVEERERLGESIGKKNRYRDDWTVWKYENAAFIDKYSSVKYGSDPDRYKERLEAYMKRYNIGKGSKISNHVVIERNHYLEGSIKIGKNVLISKNVYMDYSGRLEIQDDVSITNGVIIETHTHPMEKKGSSPLPGKLIIEQGARLLARTYIADTCHCIGRYATIGAGTFVRTNVPRYAIMIGNPAKIIGFLYSPEKMAEFEAQNYPEEDRTPIEQYRKDYQKYFLDRSKEIKQYIKK